MIEYSVLTNEIRDEEADILVSMLNAFGIEARKQYEGATEIVKITLGTAVFGVSVLVPSDKLDEALALIEAEPIYDDDAFVNNIYNDGETI